jgi:hypothetical protein
VSLFEEVYGTHSENVSQLLKCGRAAATAMLYLPHGSRCETSPRGQLALRESRVDSQLLEFAHVYLHGR